MMLAKGLVGFAALSLMAAPVLAQANLFPAVAPLTGDETGQSAEPIVIGALVTAAVVGGIIVAADGGDPVSP